MSTQLEPVEVTQAALIDEIIAMYHTTRLSGCPVADHILAKPTVQKAFARHRIATAQALEARVAELEGYFRNIEKVDEKYPAITIQFMKDTARAALKGSSHE